MAVRLLVRLCVALTAVTAALAFAAPALAANITVTTNADAGAGSLRQAITSALPGDTIVFDLPFGSQEIDLQTPLPVIAQPLTIDGSVPGAINGPQAPRIDGALLGPTGIGLEFHSGLLSTVRGLTITRFGGIGINASGDPVNIVGNFIGTDRSSATGLGNGIGVASNAAVNIGSSNPVDRNVISGNTNGINLGTGQFRRGHPGELHRHECRRHGSSRKRRRNLHRPGDE